MGWIIFGAIAAGFALLLCCSIVLHVRYDDTLGEQMEDKLLLTVGFAGFHYPLYPVREHPKKRKKKKAKRSSSSKAKPQPAKKKEKGNVNETIELIVELLYAMGKPLRVAMRRLRFRQVSIEVMVGGDDAAEIAVNYGKISALVYGGMAALRNALNIRVKRIAVSCHFLQPETAERISFCLKIRLAAIMAAAFCIAGRYLSHTIDKSRRRTAGLQSKPASDRTEAAKQEE